MSGREEVTRARQIKALSKSNARASDDNMEDKEVSNLFTYGTSDAITV